MCFDSYNTVNEYGSEIQVSTGKCGWIERKKAEMNRGYSDSEESEKKGKEKVEKELEKSFSKPVFYRYSKEQHMVSFYSAFGKGHCDNYGTKWCKKNCYMKTVPFTKSNMKKINKVDIDHWDYKFLKELMDYFVDSETIRFKYMTFFASGCIENLGNQYNFNLFKDFLRPLCYDYPLINFRFFIRDPENLVKLPENSTVIMSIDNSTPLEVIHKALLNPFINGIAIVTHPDNFVFLRSFVGDNLPEDFVKINCEDCKIHDTLECFNQKKRFILEQDYKG